jgi:siroheme decarboxylase
MASRADMTRQPSAEPAAARAGAAIPKTRSRKDGAAVPLDDTDRKLLNLMQGSFPIAPRPYRRVAELCALGEAEVMSRVARLLK